MHEKAAAVWVLLVALGLLLGLLVAVVALGVFRHLRRTRRNEARRPPSPRYDRSDDVEHPGRFPTTNRADGDEEDS